MKRKKPTHAKVKTPPGKRKGGRPPGTVLFTNEEIISALEEHHGLIFVAAKALGCTPQTIYKRAEAEECVRECIETQRGLFVDAAENSLYNKVLKGNFQSSSLVVKTLGRERGWVERTETRMGGDSTAPPIKSESTPSISLAELPLEVKKAILEALRAKKKAAEEANQVEST